MVLNQTSSRYTKGKDEKREYMADPEALISVIMPVYNAEKYLA
ncbi:MAG: glycosyltransferase family 2 protein, partial [Lacticaseibacillus paracasei]|nr:glycosyltransferase family 2 protein [Lacticaseibacillus paracasei]